MRRKGLMSIILSALVTVSFAPGHILNVSADTEDTTVETTNNSFNYGEALQKSILFYEIQRSGDLPDKTRCNWRADSAMNDGSDVGVDLTGGWYDAGDGVKFNLPGAYTSTMLAWSVYEDKDAYEKAGQLDYMLDAIKWENDFLIKCHTEPNVFYYQVGDGDTDHKWWGAPEVMQMERPSAKLDLDHPGTAVSAEAAASLSACYLIFKDRDPEYAETCLKHAKELFEFADATRSDNGYAVAAKSFYKSSGFWDDLSWASTWLYMATGDSDYLDRAEAFVANWPKEQQSDDISYSWVHCWDDVHYGTQLLLAKLTDKDIYKQSVEHNLDFWTIGYNGKRVQYSPKGLAWINNWGALRYATTAAFIAGEYADWDKADPEKAERYEKFMESQINYALGSTGRSYVTGFGVNPPEHIHHRAAQASWTDKNVEPGYNRHTLYGALVGGPNLSDSYDDEINKYECSEVACDYNAGYTGVLAKMYKKYGGNLIKNLNANETPDKDEYYVVAAVNAKDKDFTEIKALVYNKTAWPARMGDKLSFKYFIDITELINNGYSASDVKVTCGYTQGATVSQLQPWDVEKNIYYVNVDFSGLKIYPGGQSACRSEIQFRMAAPNESRVWDPSNDYSYDGVTPTPGDTPAVTEKIALYDDGKLVWGITPDGEGPEQTGGSTGETGDNTQEPEEIVLGDVNGDGTVNLSDFVLLQEYLADNSTSIKVNNTDINKDGQISIADLAALKKIILA